MPAQPPVYKLYGEHQWPTPDMVHCESIAARSRLYDWQIRPHRHHGLIQWLYLQSGAAQASLDGQRRKLPPGCVIAVPQMCAHGFQFAPDARGYVVTLGYPLIERLGKNLTDVVHVPGQPRVLPVDKSERTQLAACFACLHMEYQSTREHRSGVIDAMLTSLMIWISRQLSDEASAVSSAIATHTTPQPLNPAQRHLALFSELIEKHYQQYGSVARYATQIGITPAHLNVLCREQVGQSALSLIHQRRLLEAKRMLVYTSMTIHTISDALTFNDPAYFTRFFHRLTGLSPREFRARAADLLKPV